MEGLLVLTLIFAGVVALLNSASKTEKESKQDYNKQVNNTVITYENRLADAEMQAIYKADADYERVYEEEQMYSFYNVYD